MTPAANTLRLAPSAQPEPPEKLCLLVVEDDEADAYLIGRALADNPAVGKVVHARDGVEALSMVALGEVAPDLALIDLRMPRMDGFDLLLALGNRPSTTFPMVVLTSSAAPKDAVRSRLRSAIRVIIKPETVVDLYAVLKTTIDAVCPRNAGVFSSKPIKSPEYLLMAPRFSGLRRHDHGGDTGG